MDIYQILLVIFILASILEAIGLIIIYKKHLNDGPTEEDLKEMVNESHESGEILASEATMIQNVFEFDEKDVKDIMIHRNNIVALDSELTVREAIAYINDKNYSRFPVFEEDLDHIIGIFHIKDALKLSENPDILDKKLIDLKEELSSVVFVPETHGINTLFNLMRSKKTHMIMVVDEYGQLSGLLSMENIIEEIVGDIVDEHDEEEVTIEHVSDELFVCEGNTPLDEVEELLKTSLSDNFDTLNGYLTDKYGKVPEDGSSFIIEVDGITFTVKDVKDRVISTVEILNKSLEESENSEQL